MQDTVSKAGFTPQHECRGTDSAALMDDLRFLIFLCVAIRKEYGFPCQTFGLWPSALRLPYD